MHTAGLGFSITSITLELNLDQLTKKVEEFRKQREQLRREHSAFKSENKPFFSNNSHGYNKTLLLPLAAALVIAPVIGWIVLGQEPDEVRWRQVPATPDPRYSNALKSPAADQLEERIYSLTGNMEILSSLITDLESKLISTDQLEARISGLTENLGILNSLTTDLESRQMATDKLEVRISGLTENMETLSSLTTDLESRQIATDKLEVRISGLTENMETLNSLTTDLESKQMAADKLEVRISNITKDLQILSDLAAGLESTQVAALATTIAVVPAKRKLVSRANPELSTGAKKTPATIVPAKRELVSRTNPELSTSAKETPAIETKLASVSATPDPKPVTDGQMSKRETLRTVSREPRDSVVNKQATNSVPQNRPWNINLISSPDKAYAIRFSNKARSRGIGTQLQEVKVKGTTYWRVQVTGFSTQTEAKAYAGTVKDKLGLKDIWIMKR